MFGIVPVIGGVALTIVYMGMLIALGVGQPPTSYSGPVKQIQSICYQDAQRHDGSSRIDGIRFVMTVPANDPQPSITYGTPHEGCIAMAPEGYRLDTGVYIIVGH